MDGDLDVIQALADCVRVLSLPAAERLTHLIRCVDDDVAGSTFERIEHPWFTRAKAVLADRAGHSG
jgi:hypothetical protein